MIGLRGVSIAAALLLLVSACKSAPPPKRQRQKPVPAAASTPVVVELQYNEECLAKFAEDPRRARRPDTHMARALVRDAEEVFAQAQELESATPASDDARYADLLITALEKYKNALVKDPYSAEATLGLAVTYDKLYRKGCALTLLKRLARLDEHPAFTRDARRMMDSVDDDRSMFAGYRHDAYAAMGR